jgi:DNA-binding PadR family transcriptional regulator
LEYSLSCECSTDAARPARAGPSHGYDLKRDYDAYFGQGRPLRHSQVYATLSRLARDGKAVPGPVEQGAGPERRRYVITEAGIAEVGRWLAEPAPPEPDLHSELFAKVVLALRRAPRRPRALPTGG